MISRLCLLLALILPPALHAQIGDDPAEGRQVALPAARALAPAPPLSPREELATFQLAPGFRIELVAADPLVHDPVAAAYDLEGNLWVVEFNDYNSGLIQDLPALAKGVSPSSIPLCRIVKLESSRHDGHYDRRTVWLDGLERARGIAIVHDGVLISDSPNLWLARDPQGTGHCTEKTLVAANYEAWTDPEESGSLMWGRDNILHDIDFSYDYRYRHGVAQPLAVPVRGQFGLSQDDFGRLFFNRNSDQLHCDLFAPTYGVRNPDVTDLPWANVRIAQDQEVWPSHKTPAINRAYRPGVLGEQTGGLRPDGTLLEFTATCSPLIYRGVNFPAPFYGNALIPEPAANLIKRDLLREARGRITAVNAYEGKEFLTSTDSRFRPVALLNAPDGSVLVVDLYRGILQEYHYITTYLSGQTIGRGLDRPMFGLGRIFKITYEGGALDSRQPDFAHRSAVELTAFLANPNAWWRDAAQQEIGERGDLTAVPALNELALHAPSEATRDSALWTLDGLEATTPELLSQALTDRSAGVRAAAVRLHERWLGGPEADAAIGRLLAVLHDPEPEVSIQLALTLGEAKTPAALQAMDQLLLAAGKDSFLAKAIASGLKGREFDFFQELSGQLAATGERPGVAGMLQVLTSAIVHQGDGAQVRQLIAQTGDAGGLPKWARLAVLAGFEPLTRPAFRRSIGLTRVVKAADLASLAASSDPDIQARATRLSSGLAREEEAARQRAAAARPLTPDEQKLYEQGKVTFLVCAACHQPTGTGLPNVAPSLVDSRWVSGYPEILVHIVLNGKEGTPGFPGAMPTIAAGFSDEQIAGVLTYIRNSWGLQAGAVSPAIVAKIRKEFATRQGAWNDAELSREESDTAREYKRRGANP